MKHRLTFHILNEPGDDVIIDRRCNHVELSDILREIKTTMQAGKTGVISLYDIDGDRYIFPTQVLKNCFVHVQTLEEAHD